MLRPDLQKHTINLREGDMEYLMDFYASSNIPASQVVRLLVSDHVDKLKKNEPKLPLVEMTL